MVATKTDYKQVSIIFNFWFLFKYTVLFSLTFLLTAKFLTGTSFLPVNESFILFIFVIFIFFCLNLNIYFKNNWFKALFFSFAGIFCTIILFAVNLLIYSLYFDNSDFSMTPRNQFLAFESISDLFHSEWRFFSLKDIAIIQGFSSTVDISYEYINKNINFKK